MLFGLYILLCFRAAKLRTIIHVAVTRQGEEITFFYGCGIFCVSFLFKYGLENRAKKGKWVKMGNAAA